MQKSISLLFFVFALAAAPEARAQGKIVLPVTYSATNANMLTLWVAKDAGYFDEQGLDVRMLLIHGGSSSWAAIRNGKANRFFVFEMKRCYACKKRIWFWQHRVNVYDRYSNPAFCHRRCFARKR